MRIICLFSILQLLQLFADDCLKHYFVDNYFEYYFGDNQFEHYFDDKFNSNDSSNVISNDSLISQSYSVSSNLRLEEGEMQVAGEKIDSKLMDG